MLSDRVVLLVAKFVYTIYFSFFIWKKATNEWVSIFFSWRIEAYAVNGFEVTLCSVVTKFLRKRGDEVHSLKASQKKKSLKEPYKKVLSIKCIKWTLIYNEAT